MKPSFSFLQALMVALIATTLISSCKESDPPLPPDPPAPGLTGLFVYGSNTIATEPGSEASMMSLAVLDPGKGDMVDTKNDIYGKFIHIGMDGSIKLSQFENDDETVLGASGGGTIDSAVTVGGEINDVVLHGALEENGDPIQVSQEGLYYLYVDLNSRNFILMEVKANIIGDATENEWSTGTNLALISSDTLKTVFRGTDIPLFGSAGYRYRFNDGWHVYRDNSTVTLSSLGVPDYSAAWDAGSNNIGYHLDNAPQKEDGIYAITLTYDAKTGEWDEQKNKTSDILKDYSQTQIGWYGNAYYDADSTEGAWDTIDLTQIPSQNGTQYTWEWTMELIQDRSFVLRESGGNDEWITYSIPEKTGTAFSNGLITQETNQDNFYVTQGGMYTISLTIDADGEVRTLSIEP